jgi:hypothetical protein
MRNQRILTVFSEDSCFGFPPRAAEHRILAYGPHSIQIVRMIESDAEVFRLNVFQSETGILAQSLIHIKRVAIRCQNQDVVRNKIDDLPKLSFTVSERRFRPLALGDVHDRPNIPEFGLFVCYGMGHNVDMFTATIKNE